MELTKKMAIGVKELAKIQPNECVEYQFDDAESIGRSRGLIKYYSRTRDGRPIFQTRVFRPFTLRQDCGKWIMVVVRLK